MPDNAEYMEKLLNQTEPNPLISGLREIQELHKELTVYEWDNDNGEFKLTSDGQRIVVARLCGECTAQSVVDLIEDAAYDCAGDYNEVQHPCATRQLVDKALGETNG